jgi:hypothetical protein
MLTWLTLSTGNRSTICTLSSNMSKLAANGNPRASVTGQVIQEPDQNKYVVFEWHTLDHLPSTDSDQDLTVGQIDYTHSNEIQQDADGNLLLSSRRAHDHLRQS